MLQIHIFFSKNDDCAKIHQLLLAMIPKFISNLNPSGVNITDLRRCLMHLIFQMVKKFEYFSVYFFFLYITTTWTVLPKKKKTI